MQIFNQVLMFMNGLEEHQNKGRKNDLPGTTSYYIGLAKTDFRGQNLQRHPISPFLFPQKTAPRLFLATADVPQQEKKEAEHRYLPMCQEGVDMYITIYWYLST